MEGVCRVPRFEVSAAYVLGVMLPLLEAGRRGTDFEDLPAYLDDFIIGGPERGRGVDQRGGLSHRVDGPLCLRASGDEARP